jgi:glycine betaine/proline transport system substrate-binding protein
MTLSRKTVSLVVAGLLIFFMASGSSLMAEDLPGKGKTVTPARATWTTGYFLESLYSRALEDLGYTVEKPKDLSTPIFYKSLTMGDVDYWPNGWFPLHNSQLPANFEEKCEIAGTVVESGAIQGYLVSKEHVEKYDIKSLDDFKREDVKKAFDANGDGKADLVACPPGWGCERRIAEDLDAFELRDHINPIKAGYSASMADALARYNEGQPIFFYTWTPNWTIYKLKPGNDVMWINVPHELEGEDTVAEGVTGAVTDPITMGFVPNDIAVAANKQFLEENPAIERLFALMSVPLPDIAAQNNKMFGGEDSQRDIERHATEWIEQNQKKYDMWIEAAKDAAK